MAVAPSKSYSLWVMPRGTLAEKLHSEIRGLAARVPGAPPFAPHVTLLGGLSSADEAGVLASARQLAQQLKPYRITFGRVDCGTVFHQCVYVLCDTNPSTMQAGAAARAAYGLDPSTSYMPHLSLLYCDAGEQQRREIVAEEQQRLFGAAKQQQEGQQPPLLQEEERGFDVDSLTVWETEESDRTLLTWRQLAAFPLAG